MKIFAHRGASHDAPENSLRAFRLGWAQGADGAELDVHLSRDGRIIVCHDPDTLRTTGRSRVIAQTGSEQLRDLPLLGDVVAELPAGRELLVEIKCGAPIVPALVAARPDPARIRFLSFDREVLAAVKRALPAHQCLWNVEPPLLRAHDDPEKLIASCLGSDFAGVSLGWHAGITAPLLRRVREAGLQVAVWTVDRADIAAGCERLGVDLLMTNEPGRIREALRGG